MVPKNSKKTSKKIISRGKRHTEADVNIPVNKPKLKEASKQAKLIKLLERQEGATIDEIANAIGWQKHSIRGTMSGVLKKRLGFSINSEKDERGRIYRIVVDAI